MFSVYSGLGLSVWARYHRSDEKRRVSSLELELELETLAKHSPRSSRPAARYSPGGGKARRAPGEPGWGRSLGGAGAGGVVSTAAAAAASQNHQEEKEFLLGSR